MRTKELRLKFVGFDDFQRRVYVNMEDRKRFYKTSDSYATVYNLYTSNGFYGEPSLELRKDLKLIVQEE